MASTADQVFNYNLADRTKQNLNVLTFLPKFLLKQNLSVFLLNYHKLRTQRTPKCDRKHCINMLCNVRRTSVANLHCVGHCLSPRYTHSLAQQVQQHYMVQESKLEAWLVKVVLFVKHTIWRECIYKFLRVTLTLYFTTATVLL